MLTSIRQTFPWLRHVFADEGYAGDKLRSALNTIGSWTLEIIKRPDVAKGFERTIQSATTRLFIASVNQITQRIASLCNQDASL